MSEKEIHTGLRHLFDIGTAHLEDDDFEKLRLAIQHDARSKPTVIGTCNARQRHKCDGPSPPFHLYIVRPLPITQRDPVTGVWPALGPWKLNVGVEYSDITYCPYCGKLLPGPNEQPEDHP